MERRGDEQKLRNTKDEFQNPKSSHPCSDRPRWNFSSLHLLLWSLILITLCPITGVTSATFPIGTNITQTCAFELTSQYSTIDSAARIGDMDQPFFYANQIDPHFLKPGQDGRFTVQVHQSGKNVSITLSIADIQPIDEGTYWITVFEEYDGSVQSKEKTVNIVMWDPPGKAECKVQTPYFPIYHRLKVSCNATAGSDSHGSILCFQDFRRSLHYLPATLVDDQISAGFWLNPALPAVCCSASNDSMIDQDSCKDFEYLPTGGHHLSTDLVSSTSTTSTSMDFTMSPPAKSQPNISAVVIGTVTVIAFVLIIILVIFKMSRKSRSSSSNGTTSSQTNGHGGQNNYSVLNCNVAINGPDSSCTPNRAPESVVMIDQNV